MPKPLRDVGCHQKTLRPFPAPLNLREVRSGLETWRSFLAVNPTRVFWRFYRVRGNRWGRCFLPARARVDHLIQAQVRWKHLNSLDPWRMRFLREVLPGRCLDSLLLGSDFCAFSSSSASSLASAALVSSTLSMRARACFGIFLSIWNFAKRSE